MHELLPLSWIRIHGIRPVYRDIALPFSRTRWISYADIPYDYTLQILYEDLSRSYPDGYVLRGCTPSTGTFFFERSCMTLRTGAEAVLELNRSHLERKTVLGSLARGARQGEVTEILMNEANQHHFEQFRRETKHAHKPQLRHLFRENPSRACRCFVFRSCSGQWLAAITLSARGLTEVHTELMLRHRSAPGDIMESLVAGIFEILKSEGFLEWSLGEVPFMMLMQNPEEPLTPIEQLMVSLVSNWKHVYDFEGLYRFKNKFAPLWRPVMLCTNRNLSPFMLAQLAVSMGFTDILTHESFGMFRQSLISV
ncbi:phosphatidylglycerol lysyltransferase domain-containing protein [Chlorobium ferrooxidans]|nr:phosphatidylglycerol lysyltransferase domain-containing protein [Chlorobium ferrooxidans]